jgi:hypothetical protein
MRAKGDHVELSRIKTGNPVRLVGTVVYADHATTIRFTDCAGVRFLVEESQVRLRDEFAALPTALTSTLTETSRPHL